MIRPVASGILHQLRNHACIQAIPGRGYGSIPAYYPVPYQPFDWLPATLVTVGVASTNIGCIQAKARALRACLPAYLLSCLPARHFVRKCSGGGGGEETVHGGFTFPLR